MSQALKSVDARAAADLGNLWKIENAWFKPRQADSPEVSILRSKARDLAIAMIQKTPHCPDQSIAIRKLREAVMMAEQAIICEGR